MVKGKIERMKWGKLSKRVSRTSVFGPDDAEQLSQGLHQWFSTGATLYLRGHWQHMETFLVLTAGLERSNAMNS